MAEKIRVAILDDYQQVALNMADWGQLADSIELVVFSQQLKTNAEIISALASFEVICIMRERTAFSRDIFEGLGKLKLLITSGANNASIDLAAASDNGVRVCGTTSPGHAASELAWGLILALSRHIVSEDLSIRNGQWQTTVGRDLKGQTLGVIGLGRHGSNVTRYAKVFGMRVIAWSQNLTEQRCRDLDVELVDKHTLLRDSDIITIHLQMGLRYRGLIDANALAMMNLDSAVDRSSWRVINCFVGQFSRFIFSPSR